MSGILYLLPCPLAPETALQTLPATTLQAARRLRHFLAENAKTTRGFLKEIDHPVALRELQIVEIGHAPLADAVDGWLAPALAGADMAIVSEAGCPGVADPGAVIVARAHEKGLRVQPLVGPSSLLLALMAAGGNGQQFRFVGYLPHEAVELAARLRELDTAARRGETQLFIETPYRNDKLFDAIVASCSASTRLTLATDLTAASEQVATRTVAQWRALLPASRPILSRRPTVFILSAALTDPR